VSAGGGRSAAPVVVSDLDGVIWRGDEAIAGAAGGVSALRAAGVRVGFVTNNSSGTVESYLERLARAGVDADPDDVLTSALAAALLLARRLPGGGRVLACAGEGVRAALRERGFEVVAEGPADAVVVGWHREFDFDGLAAAADVARRGALFVATNLDATYPVPGGLLPGCGALVAAVATAAAREPEVAGKPAAAMIELVRERFGTRGVIVGDRPSTDGALAAALGWPFALVLSGVAGPDGEEAVPDPPPPFVSPDFGSLAPMLVDAFGAARA
jgi:HAD superfamily hydrolase (TIGR01450 family)